MPILSKFTQKAGSYFWASPKELIAGVALPMMRRNGESKS
jgi:hypothetical protein